MLGLAVGVVVGVVVEGVAAGEVGVEGVGEHKMAGWSLEEDLSGSYPDLVLSLHFHFRNLGMEKSKMYLLGLKVR